MSIIYKTGSCTHLISFQVCEVSRMGSISTVFQIADGREALGMATESFLKNITVRNTKSKKQLVLALENARKKTSKPVVMSRTVQRVSRSKLKDFMGDI